MKNDHQLRRWLMAEVHGVEIPRKPPQRASVLSRNTPARNWKYRAWIRSLPCACCGTTPAGEAAHSGSDGGMGHKSSDYSCVPLCDQHHRLGADSYHRIGRKQFEVHHNLDLSDIVKRLNRIWFHPQSRLVG